MTRPRTYRVGDVARLAGVSVRTLHHYEAVGLLVPSGRSESGYRLYADRDLLRLQQVLVRRELGMPLETIRCSLDDPAFDLRRALAEQRSRLRAQGRRVDRMIRSIDAALAVLDGQEDKMADMREIFDGFDSSEHVVEAEQRWGATDAYQESARRTKRYSPDDWRRIKQEQEAVYADAATALREGRRAADADVMDIAERHRRSIDRWFYPCSPEMHRGLADLYEADGRFAAAFERHAEGLAAFFAAAVRANAERSGEH